VAVDLQLVTSQIWARLASDLDAPAAAVRAALGAGATSIIHADQLVQEPRPARPFLAFRGGSLTGESFDMRPFFCRWFVYDDPGQGHWRINGLVPLIEAAYPRFCVPYGRIVVSLVTDERPDDTLNLLFRSIQLIYTRRG
jgi:hypothetical protein